MKVVFLDIDGVMNSTDEMLELLKQDSKNRFDISLPSPSKCMLLKQLVDETGAEIVLSSSWRRSLNAIQNIIDTFRPYGLRLDGFTQEEVSTVKFKNTKFESINPRHVYEGYLDSFTDDRGAEIAYWLLKHPEVTDFVILDDEDSDIKAWLPDNIIKTETKCGLTEENVIAAIKLLTKSRK